MLKFLCCFLITFSVFSEMRTIHSLEEIPRESFSEKTLVMLDLDDVLIYPQDALMQNWRNEWKPKGIRSWTDEEDTLSWMHLEFQLMDPLGPKLIDDLRKNGIPTIGFTSFSVDRPDIVASIPQWRSQHLKKLGLHFKEDKEVVFLTPEGIVPPSFEKGVLYCGDLYKKDKDNKGKILSLYLNWLDWTPEQVILVDDSKNNLESIETELTKRNIPFVGFLYIPKELDPVDEKIAELQYITMIEKKQWLSDEEAQKLLSPLPQ